MKLAIQQLEQHLKKNLAPIYWIHGDDYLLIQDSVESIRTTAKQSGYNERISITIEPHHDWIKTLYEEFNHHSLFSTKRIIEMHLGESKINAEASKILQEIARLPSTDNILLISSHKLDSKTEKVAWYKAIDKIGVFMPIWPISNEQLPGWLIVRAKKIGLTLTADAAKILAEHVEGNLLAAAQELEKFLLLELPPVINAQVIENLVTDNAHFDIFGLVDCVLSGNGQRSLRILRTLKAEAMESILILWALTRELRTLFKLAKQIQSGIPLHTLFSQYRIWEKRQPIVRRFLQTHTATDCLRFLAFSAKIDRQIKGAEPGSVWDSLEQLLLSMAGCDKIKI